MPRSGTELRFESEPGCVTPVDFSDITNFENDRADTVRLLWQRSLSAAVRDPDELIDRLRLPEEFREPARRAALLFPLLVPESYLARMAVGDPHDPLLRQVLPLALEADDVPGFSKDALHESEYRAAPGLLHKYAGRALLIATGTCAVHCRYCFRRHYPYGEEPRRREDWHPALDAIAADESVTEIILSGGDPLMLSDRRLAELLTAIDAIPHVKRIRLHTRLPIVLPDRITPDFLALLSPSPREEGLGEGKFPATDSQNQKSPPHSAFGHPLPKERGLRSTPIVVVHANHPNEIAGDCETALRALVRSGITVLNQSVLLRGVNDNAEALAYLSERLVNLGVMPYYLHQLDRVSGTAHFEVDEETGRRLIRELRRRLPGYAVPQYVREVPGEHFKMPLFDDLETGNQTTEADR